MAFEQLDGDWVCAHGHALDVHCCACDRSGFTGDAAACTCGYARDDNEPPEFDPDFDLPDNDPPGDA